MASIEGPLRRKASVLAYRVAVESTERYVLEIREAHQQHVPGPSRDPAAPSLGLRSSPGRGLRTT